MGFNTEKRGTQNELESIKMIVLENRTLFLRVMDKIRIYREMRGLSAFDEIKKQQDVKVKKRKERGKL